MVTESIDVAITANWSERFHRADNAIFELIVRVPSLQVRATDHEMHDQYTTIVRSKTVHIVPNHPKPVPHNVIPVNHFR